MFTGYDTFRGRPRGLVAVPHPGAKMVEPRLHKQAINKLIAYHIAFLSHKGDGADMTTPIEKMWEASVWETHSDGSTNLSAQQCPPELRFPSS